MTTSDDHPYQIGRGRPPSALALQARPVRESAWTTKASPVLQNGRWQVSAFDQWRGRVHKSIFANHIRAMRANYRAQMILIEDNGPALDFLKYAA